MESKNARRPETFSSSAWSRAVFLNGFVMMLPGFGQMLRSSRARCSTKPDPSRSLEGAQEHEHRDPLPPDVLGLRGAGHRGLSDQLDQQPGLLQRSGVVLEGMGGA